MENEKWKLLIEEPYKCKLNLQDDLTKSERLAKIKEQLDTCYDLTLKKLEEEVMNDDKDATYAEIDFGIYIYTGYQKNES